MRIAMKKAVNEIHQEYFKTGLVSLRKSSDD